MKELSTLPKKLRLSALALAVASSASPCGQNSGNSRYRNSGITGFWDLGRDRNILVSISLNRVSKVKNSKILVLVFTQW